MPKREPRTLEKQCWFVLDPVMQVPADQFIAFLKEHSYCAIRDRAIVYEFDGTPIELPFASKGAKLFITIAEYLEHYTPVREPLYVMDDDLCLEGMFDGRELEALNAALEEKAPMKWLPYGYLFGTTFWRLEQSEMHLNDEQLRLVFLETIDNERQRFERLKRKFSGVGGEPLSVRRDAIPEEVRIFVWRRDEGKCVQCGSRERLEYDHVIPVCVGGSSTSRNIQLLCEQCNRKKGPFV